MLPPLILFLAGFLIFQIQPVLAKMILPHFGGGAVVWLGALFFFQLFLWLGYSLSHWSRKLFSPRKQAALELVLLFASFLFLPIQLWLLDLSAPPALEISLILALSAGLPYLVLSTTNPLLQHWFSLDTQNQNRNPYVLFAFSNLGSLLGLLTYPFLVEPFLTLPAQSRLWTGLYFFYSACILLYLWGWKKGLPDPAGSTYSEALPEISLAKKSFWTLTAFLPSAFLLAVTHHLTQDIASFPLLWVLPLSLYLLSFVFCFYFPQISSPSRGRTVFVLLSLWILLLASMASYYIKDPLPLAAEIGLGCLGLFAFALYFHGELERGKPSEKGLTTFYLYLCLGGALGGLSVTLIFPLLFPSAYEFYFLLFLAILWVSFASARQWPRGRRILYFTAFMTLFTINFLMEVTTFHPWVQHRARSYYSSYQVLDLPAEKGERKTRLLIQGSTIHGGQIETAEGHLVPATYYHQDTGIYQIFRSEKFNLERVGIVGLGAGSLALLGRRGQKMDFFEIDPLVLDLARDHFKIEKRSPAHLNFYLGDGRQSLAQIDSKTYDLLVLDAFTSDAVPAHLLTKEGTREYLQVLKKEGILIFNISNKYLDFRPLIRGLAREFDLSYAFHQAPRNMDNFEFPAHWALVTSKKELIDHLKDRDPRWKTDSGPALLWTDDYHYLWPLVKSLGK